MILVFGNFLKIYGELFEIKSILKFLSKSIGTPCEHFDQIYFFKKKNVSKKFKVFT